MAHRGRFPNEKDSAPSTIGHNTWDSDHDGSRSAPGYQVRETNVAKTGRLAPGHGPPREPLDRSTPSSKRRKHATGVDVIFSDIGFDGCTTNNLGMRLRRAKVPHGGILPTSPSLDHPTPSCDPEFRPDVSETGANPRKPDGQMLASAGSSPGDDDPGSPEREPEMLLVPETRPISHEQLVIEAKGIYAGLIMVEAKCIDIDERQFAAAQEKDPTKKTALKNDQ